MSRVIAHEDIHDEIIDRCVALAEGLSVGPGIDRTDFGANMGAMVSDPQRDRAEGLVEAAAAEGASIATGGRRLNLPGSLFAPTVISDVTPNMQIAGTEVFGPVLSILKTTAKRRQSTSPTAPSTGLSAASLPLISTLRTGPRGAFVLVRFSSMNGLQAG